MGTKMTNQDEQIAKIYEILSQNPKNITELTRILNVSTKTIERDIKNPLISNQLQKISQKWSIKEDSKSAFVSNMLDKLSFSLGADFYQKACKYVHYGISNMHLADLALFVDIGSEKLESQHIDYILLLQSVIIKKIQIQLNYKNQNRTIKPLKVALFSSF